jgi:hypothetical protein
MQRIVTKLFKWDTHEWDRKKRQLLSLCSLVIVIIFGIIPWIYGIFHIYVFKIFGIGE